MNCVIQGCGRKVDRRWCLCGEHYRILPEDLRAALSRAYNPHLELGDQAPGFFTARARVQGWMAETFGVEDKRPRQSWEQLVAWVRERDAARGQRTPPPPPRSASEPDDPAPAPPAQMELL